MDSHQYLKVLEEQLIPEFEAALFGGDWSAARVRKFLAEINAPMLDWPPYSPDFRGSNNIMTLCLKNPAHNAIIILLNPP